MSKEKELLEEYKGKLQKVQEESTQIQQRLGVLMAQKEQLLGAMYAMERVLGLVDENGKPIEQD